MFLVGTTYFPPNKVTEVTKRFVKAVETPLPPVLKRVNVLASAAGEQWFKVLSIYEVNDAELADGIKELVKYETQFLDIEGYRYQLDVMVTAEEGIPLIGI